MFERSPWTKPPRPLSPLAALQGAKVGLFMFRQAIDTATAARKALFAICGVSAELRTEIIRERVIAGIAGGPREGTKSGCQLDVQARHSVTVNLDIALRFRWVTSGEPPRRPFLAAAQFTIPPSRRSSPNTNSTRTDFMKACATSSMKKGSGIKLLTDNFFFSN